MARGTDVDYPSVFGSVWSNNIDVLFKKKKLNAKIHLQFTK